MLKANDLPTDIVWVSWHHVKLTHLSRAQAYYSKIDEHKRSTHQIFANQLAGGGDEYLQLNEAQTELTKHTPEGAHLFINLTNPLSEQAIEKIFEKRTSDHHMVVFYAIAEHENKTVAGIIFDWLGEDESDHSHDFHMIPNSQTVFSVNEAWKAPELTIINESNDWREIQGLPMKLSNLDYLTVAD